MSSTHVRRVSSLWFSSRIVQGGLIINPLVIKPTAVIMKRLLVKSLITEA